VVRPYKTRAVFSDLTNRVIYLNEYLIDEEILEYLILREMVHIRLHVPSDEIRRQLDLRGEV
jgi:hypothetical protein